MTEYGVSGMFVTAADLPAEFLIMCKTKSEGPYARALQEATSSFAALSTTVRDVESQLREDDLPELAASIRHIQEHERDKLRATISLQALRKAEAFDTFSWQQDGGALAGAHADGAGVRHALQCVDFSLQQQSVHRIVEL